MTPSPFDLSEPDLNRLGYKLLGDRRWADAIGIFRMNVESHPRSGNVYDSLAEAYYGQRRQAAGDRLL